MFSPNSSHVFSSPLVYHGGREDHKQSHVKAAEERQGAFYQDPS
jgi:hypothetical protein